MFPEHLLGPRCSAGRQYTDIETCTAFQANGGKKTGHINKRNRWNFLDQRREGFFLYHDSYRGGRGIAGDLKVEFV